MEEFILNVFVSKLKIETELDTNESAILEFNWDDDEKFKIQLQENYDQLHNIKFKEESEQLIDKLEEKPFKLKALKKKDKGEDERNDKMENKSDDKVEKKPDENVDTEETVVEEEIIGETQCSWPPQLIASLKNKDWVITPFTMQADLLMNGKIVVTVTLSIILHPKCNLDKTNSDPTVPFVDKEGKLTIFKAVQDQLEPNDVFFVIGDSPDPQPMNKNMFTSCGCKTPCPADYDVERYRNMKGALTNECKNIINCGLPKCSAADKDDDDDLSILKDCKQQIQAGVCCMDPCERLFGPIDDPCNGLTCKDLGLPCHNEFNHKVLYCKLDGNRKKLKSGKRHKVKRTRSDKRLKRNADSEENKKRYCPICCEKICEESCQEICSKCGFTRKMALPIKARDYDESKTAKDLLASLNTSTGKPYNQTLNNAPNLKCPDSIGRRIRVLKNKNNNHDGDSINSNCGSDISSIYQRLFDTEKGRKPKSLFLNKIRKIGKFIEAALELNLRKITEQKELPDQKTTRESESEKEKDRVMQCCKMNTLLKTYEVNKTESEFLSKITNEKSRRQARTKILKKSIQSNTNMKRIPTICKECCMAKDGKKSGDKSGQKKKLNQIVVNRCPSKKVKYYSFDEYPGVIKGHKHCVTLSRKIPRYMGWLWSASISDDLRCGWRPGAVRRPTHRIMKFFQKLHVQKKSNDILAGGDACNIPATTPDRAPRIKVTKKNGKYHISIHPMPNPCNAKDSNSIPLEFTIDKDPVNLTKQFIKSQLKQLGFAPCTCGKRLTKCTCRRKKERANLRDMVKMLCQQLNAAHLKDQIYFSDTTESRSEMDMEFTTPVAFCRDKLMRQPKTAYASTQYEPDDIKVIHPEPEVWNYCDQEFKTRLHRGPCSALSRLPPCRDPKIKFTVPLPAKKLPKPPNPFFPTFKTPVRKPAAQKKLILGRIPKSSMKKPDEPTPPAKKKKSKTDEPTDKPTDPIDTENTKTKKKGKSNKSDNGEKDEKDEKGNKPDDQEKAKQSTHLPVSRIRRKTTQTKTQKKTALPAETIRPPPPLTRPTKPRQQMPDSKKLVDILKGLQTTGMRPVKQRMSGLGDGDDYDICQTVPLVDVQFKAHSCPMSKNNRQDSPIYPETISDVLRPEHSKVVRVCP